jgi:hypothetical protein
MEQNRQETPSRKPSVRKPSENASEGSAANAGSKSLGSLKTDTPASGRLGSVNDDSKKTRGGASKVSVLYRSTL